MGDNIGFDHQIGQNNEEMSAMDLALYQRIIKAHAEGQTTQEKQTIQTINVKLEMEDYLDSEAGTLKPAGYFLEKLLKIYNIKKARFADFISIEKTNFYALLKGRRKFNIKIASRVGEIFNINPQIWLFIEAKNEVKAFQKDPRENSTKYSLDALLKKV